MSALFIPTARSLQSVSSETVPQQLMYKLEQTGASGCAKIGTLLGVIFHSISNFVFFFLCHTEKEVYQHRCLPPSLLSLLLSHCVRQVINTFLGLIQFIRVFSKKRRATLYPVHAVCCGEVKHKPKFLTWWLRSSTRQSGSNKKRVPSPCWCVFIIVTGQKRSLRKQFSKNLKVKQLVSWTAEKNALFRETLDSFILDFTVCWYYILLLVSD